MAGKTYWNPYTGQQEPVLTQDEIDQLWPNRVPKSKIGPATSRGGTVDAATEDALREVAPADRSGPMSPMTDMELFPVPSDPLDAAAQAHVEAGEQMELPLGDIITALNIGSAVERGVSPDMVVLPKHYSRFDIEPIRFICENRLNFFQGNIVKYVLRHDAKNGLEDLKKAKRYLEMFIKFTEGDKDWWK